MAQAGLLIPASDPAKTRIRELAVFGRALIENPSAGGVRLANLAAAATVSANERLQTWLHPWSAYFVIPAFGLANAGVSLSMENLRIAAHSRLTIGIVVALVLGNAIGITVGSTIALRTGIGILPGRVRYSHLFGGAVLAGIGFTISLFIAELAFTDAALMEQAKIGILAGSLVAAVLGSITLRALGNRFPMCSPGAGESTLALPPRPWRAPQPVVAPGG